MSPIRIVFTGGPCAGKTTLINMVREYLEQEGYKVIYVSETATDLYNAGIDYSYINSSINFQTIILKYQYFKEKMAESVIGDNEKTIILYDRAILDNKAYFNNYRDFNYILQNIPDGEINVLDKYDLVLDLLSLASCDSIKYSLSSNKARKESLKEAINLDLKTSNAWVGHRNLYLFNSNIELNREFELIIDRINKYLNGNNKRDITSIEIENTLGNFSDYNDNNSRLINVERIILDGCEIQRRTYKGFISYVLFKDSISKSISFEEYLEILNRYDILSTEKYKSLSFVRDKQLFEIKFFNDKTILEYEENKLNEELVLPSEINCKVKEKVLR